VKTKPENMLPKTLPGAVCVQMVRCGKANCKCARGELHGPYFYHFTRVQGTLIKRYVKAKDATLIRAACDARRRNERRSRLTHKINIRELIRLVEKLRETEKHLFQYIEVSHEETKKGS
jgi:hypothetical protein